MLSWLRKLWPVQTLEQELSEENPHPIHPDYEAFHVSADRHYSKHVADLLKKAGVRINETAWNQIGHPEYVIEVHTDDLENAGKLFWKDADPSRTFTSSNSEPSTPGNAAKQRI